MMSLLLATALARLPRQPRLFEGIFFEPGLCLPVAPTRCSTHSRSPRSIPTATARRSEAHGRQGSTHRLLLRLSDGVA